MSDTLWRFMLLLLLYKSKKSKDASKYFNIELCN